MRRAYRAFAATLGLLLSTFALAQSPRLENIVLSDSKQGMSRAAFTANTKAIFLRADLRDVPPGALLRGDWIAVKTKIAPPNHKFNSARLSVAPGMVRADFSLDRPADGFPPGDYRVDLFINNRKVHAVTYTVR